jgi:hypothetical protein
MHSRPIENEAEAAYQAALPPLGLAPGGGISLICPSCGKCSWMRLPVRALGWFFSGVGFSCPTACGYFGELRTFSPTVEEACPDAMDSRGECKSCHVEFAADGVVLRRPCCAIETPREVMRETTAYIEERVNTLPAGPSLRRRELELLLGCVVSTFDGLMRGMLAIANENRRRLPLDHPYRSSIDAMPSSMSFQSLNGARQKLLPTGWDMQQGADWGALTTLFQKRHTISHQLGVADQAYLTKTGDGSAELGKRVPLSAEEIVYGSKQCQLLINGFFGMFLS